MSWWPVRYLINTNRTLWTLIKVYNTYSINSWHTHYLSIFFTTLGFIYTCKQKYQMSFNLYPDLMKLVWNYIYSWYKLQLLSPPTLVCFFQAIGLFSIENAKFFPVSARFGQCWLFFINFLITFFRTFIGQKKCWWTKREKYHVWLYERAFLYWHTFLGKYQAWQTTRDYGISRVYWLRIDGNGKIGHHDK